MTVTLMTCNDDNKVINKNPSAVVSKNCKVYNNCSILTPNIVLEYSSQITGCNYCYIPEWGRYFWIVDYHLEPGQRCVIDLHCDVLMSFKPGISNVKCYIKKASNKNANAAYLPDGNIPVSSDTFVRNVQFSSSPFDGNELSHMWYVIGVLGG